MPENCGRKSGEQNELAGLGVEGKSGDCYRLWPVRALEMRRIWRKTDWKMDFRGHKRDSAGFPLASFDITATAKRSFVREVDTAEVVDFGNQDF
jgi:hypothetical protein